MTIDLLLVTMLCWHEADDQLKISGQTPNQSCVLRVFHSTVNHWLFTSSFFSVLSITLSDRGLLTTRGHTHTWADAETRAHTHTSTHYTLLLFINLQGVNWIPPESDRTCSPSLIISQGAFGGKQNGGWAWMERHPESVTVQLYFCRHDSIQMPYCFQTEERCLASLVHH